MRQLGRWGLLWLIGACFLTSSAMGQEPQESQTAGSDLGLSALGDSQADLVYSPVTPCRIINTLLAGGPIAADGTRSFRVTGTDFSSQGGSSGNCNVPVGATGAVINFVAVNPTGAGDLRYTPYGTVMPLASFLNYVNSGIPNDNTANGMTFPICNPAIKTCTNDFTIQADVSATDLVADVQGYFRQVAAGGVGTVLLADAGVTAPKIAAGVVVRSLNGQTESVTLGGTNGLDVSAGSGMVTVTTNATSLNAPGTIVSRDGTGSVSAGSVGLAGNLALPNTTSSSAGVLTKGGTPFLHNFGTNNTFVGSGAGNLSLTGASNTAVGTSALQASTSGYYNSAFGYYALQANTTGPHNSAFGYRALQANTSAGANSAFGVDALRTNTAGSYNSAFGVQALYANTTANYNSAFGYAALASSTTAEFNSAFGYYALQSNTSGASNSAFGFQALANTTASYNSAFGYYALLADTVGDSNSAFGFEALRANTTAHHNSAFGNRALRANTGGGNNSAFGDNALAANTGGGTNSAFGDNALGANTTGGSNSAFGYYALGANTTGNGNAAFGWRTLHQLSSGGSNLALGMLAGSVLTSGSYNIYVGNSGVSSESNTTRIGDDQTATYVAGISGATSAGGVAVYVDSFGKLGTITSSRRYKEEIVDMGEESDVLMKLRPVSFYYRPELDAEHVRQYGLVAEEVEELAPGLVARDETGAPQTVRYHFVNAMLLNEMQKQRRRLEAQDGQLRTQQAEIRELRAQQGLIQDLKEQLARLEARLPQ